MACRPSLQKDGIPGYRELRCKIKRNFTAIASKHGLSNARMEATNNKIKLGIRTELVSDFEKNNRRIKWEKINM